MVTTRANSKNNDNTSPPPNEKDSFIPIESKDSQGNPSSHSKCGGKEDSESAKPCVNEILNISSPPKDEKQAVQADGSQSLEQEFIHYSELLDGTPDGKYNNC
jgi:hypothetical protein